MQFFPAIYNWNLCSFITTGPTHDTTISQSNEPVLITLSCMYQIIIAIDFLSVYGSHFVVANYCHQVKKQIELMCG